MGEGQHRLIPTSWPSRRGVRGAVVEVGVPRLHVDDVEGGGRETRVDDGDAGLTEWGVHASTQTRAREGEEEEEEGVSHRCTT